MQALNLTRFAHRASYITDRLDQAEEEIKATRDALSSADLSPVQADRARRLLSNISLLLDRAHDEADELNRLQYNRS